MGQDIHGWVEIAWNPPDDWGAVLRIGLLVERNSLLWGWLFQAAGSFRSVAADRGLPVNVSAEIAAEVQQLRALIDSGEVHSFSWVTWGELEAIDWDEGPIPGGQPAWIEVQTGRTDGGHPLLVQHPVTSRRATLARSPGWQLLFDLMRRLARDYGGDHVRLVVWFDG